MKLRIQLLDLTANKNTGEERLVNLMELVENIHTKVDRKKRGREILKRM